jgi:SOS-response transcriptional repressor LexA
MFPPRNSVLESKKEPPMFLPHKLRTLLEQRRMRPADLSRASGIPPASITRYLHGERQPTVENLTRIAEALGVPIDMLTSSSAPVKTSEPMTDLEVAFALRELAEKIGRRSASEEAAGVSGVLRIPVLTGVDNGLPADVKKAQVKQWIGLPSGWVKDQEAFAFVAESQALSDFGVAINDYVIVAPSVQVQDGDIVLAEFSTPEGPQILLRRVRFVDDKVVLETAKSDAQALILERSDSKLKIAGPVVFSGRQYKSDWRK